MNILYRITFIMCLCFLSCSKDASSSDLENGVKVIEFRVKTLGGEVIGKINEENRTILLPGIKYTSSINDVAFQLEEGFSAMTDPLQWIGSWEREKTFSLKDSNGQVYRYRVLISDFERVNEKPYVVGYILGPCEEHIFSLIKWELLTHVNVSFLGVKATGEFESEVVRKDIQKIKDIARKHEVKVLVSLNSAIGNSFFQAIQSESSKRRLIDNLLAFVDQYELDGIDIDYEIYDKIGPELIDFIKTLYDKKEKETLLTCAVAPWNPTAAGGYTKEWHKYFDIINIMTYDFTGGWGQEGQHSSFSDTMNSVDLWMKQLKAPAYKLTIGLPFYGYTWDEKVFPNSVGGSVNYSLILKKCIKMFPDENVWEIDQIGKTYYNGQETIKKKCQTAMRYGLGGVMIWQLLHDTYEEEYEEYSLMNAIEEGLKQ